MADHPDEFDLLLPIGLHLDFENLGVDRGSCLSQYRKDGTDLVGEKAASRS